MSEIKVDSRQRDLLHKIWRDLKKRMDIKFMIILDYHVYKVKSEHAEKLFTEYPYKFREAFIIIFGGGLWRLFEKIILEICKKNKYNCSIIYPLFRPEYYSFEQLD